MQDKLKDKLINYDRLDRLVKSFEEWKENQELDIDEEKLLMDILKDRRETKLMKLRTDDYLGNFNNSLFGSIFKKAKKESEKEEGDE